MRPRCSLPPSDSLSWPSELQLLLHCGQAVETPENGQAIDELLGGTLDWRYLLDSASVSGMLPLLGVRIATFPTAPVPPGIRKTLLSYTRALHARNLQSVGELCALVDLFTSRGLRVMPFKGPVLAVQAYGTLSLRPFADLDLLVSAEDVPAACELLVNRQYTPRYTMSAGQRANLLRFGCEHPFQRVIKAPPDGAEPGRLPSTRKDDIDLHWNLFPPSFPIDFDPQILWNQVETVALGRREFTTIGVDALVLYLCAHGYAHHWSRLEWICALGRLIAARPGIDWLWIQQEAVRTGAERVLELGLVLASDWMNAPVPAYLIAEARSRPAMKTLLQHVTARIVRDPAEGVVPESTLNEELFFDLDARENWRRRVSYFLRRLITPSLEDIEWVSVPARLPALYYLLRPLRLSIRSLSSPGAATGAITSVSTLVAIFDEGSAHFPYLSVAHRGAAQGGVPAPDVRLGSAGPRAGPLVQLWGVACARPR